VIVNLLNSSESAFSFLIAWPVKATVLFISAWVLAAMLRRQSAALRHRVWTAGVAGSLALPVLTLLLPAWHSTVWRGAAALWAPVKMATGSSSESLPAMMVNAGAASPLLGRAVVLVLSVWAAGCFVLTLRLAVGLARIARQSMQASPLLAEGWALRTAEICQSLKITRSVRILQCGNPLAMPLTWGIFRPAVIFPANVSEWPDDRRRMVLLHELAHVARRDWFWQMSAELARSLYWFHPLAWIAAGRLRQESERACDDAVLRTGIEASEYANQLLDLAKRFENADRRWSAALAVARPSTLERRFTAMLNPSIDRSQISRRSGRLTVLITLCLLLPLAALRLPAQSPSGGFRGTIHDPTGTGVRNATVMMADHKSNTTEMTTSDADGNFNFKALPAGEYEMRVTKRGFEVYRMPRVVLEPGRESSQSVTLEVAAVTEEVDVVAEGAAQGQAAPETRPKTPRLSLGGAVQATRLLNKVQPVYPAAAREAGIQGTVILHAVIGMNGKPLSLRVMNNEVDPELARSAVESVSQWRYRPTLLNGEPIEVDTTIMVNFSLQP
jgi:TonB family protein